MLSRSERDSGLGFGSDSLNTVGWESVKTPPLWVGFGALLPKSLHTSLESFNYTAYLILLF